MPFHILSSNESLKAAEDLGFSSELRKFSSKQRSSSSSRIAQERDMLKSRNGISLPVGNQSRDSVNRSTTKSDELIRYMSNLPGYLQRTDRGENIQEKALNVGVLDWSRLENWKQRANHIPAVASKFLSFSSSQSLSKTATKTSTSAPRSAKFADQQVLHSTSIKASYKVGESRGANPSVQNVKRFQHSKTETWRCGDEERMAPATSKSFGKTHSGLLLEREKKRGSDKMTSEIGNLASNLKHHEVLLCPNENKNDRQSEDEKSRERSPESSIEKKDRKYKSTSDMGLPLSFPKTKGVSLDSKKKMNSSNVEAKKKVVELSKPDSDIDHKPCHSKRHNIVLLCPKEIPRTSSPEVTQHSKPRMSFEGNLTEASDSSLSNFPLPGQVYSEDLCHDIQHSRTQQSVAEPVPNSNIVQHSIDSSRRIDHSSVLSQTPTLSRKMSGLQSESTIIEKDASDINLTSDSAFSKLKDSRDQETAELTDKSGKISSPNRRFSFSLTRIGRSFSFKEGSGLPKFGATYVSAKSGPVTSESSAMDNSSQEKAKGHNRTRSSPLRRLLDPILKYKAANIHHSSEISQPAQGSLGSTSFRRMGVSEMLDVGKNEGSIKALLQLSIKNGRPLFKFVLNNERNMLAAAMKNLASPEKGDSGCNFTFYLVNDIKKRSGSWIGQGSKEKGCGYVYNVVAQMKVSSTRITAQGSQDSKKHCMVKEYALLGVDIGQTDLGSPKLIRGRELAAIVVEIPCENLGHEGLYCDENLLKGCLAEDRYLCSSGKVEIPACSSTTVILPGGIHGSPEKGEPSPLIYRWKSGGSCDCGGWDIGCKLLVLSNQKQSSKSNDRFQLFVQEDEKDSPCFSLVPLKEGFYSVEFDSSITRLQAFFICVATLSHQKLPNSTEISKMDEEFAKEPSLKNNGRIQGKAPVKYTPIPPLSPVGRV